MRAFRPTTRRPAACHPVRNTAGPPGRCALAGKRSRLRWRSPRGEPSRRGAPDANHRPSGAKHNTSTGPWCPRSDAHAAPSAFPDSYRGIARRRGQDAARPAQSRPHSRPRHDRADRSPLCRGGIPTRTVPSAPTQGQPLPVRREPDPLTHPLCPRSVAITLPLSTSHRRTVPSRDADATHCHPGAKQTLSTASW